MIASFGIAIEYSQIVVFNSGGAISELQWTKQHVAQGFAWSPGDVAFGVPDHDGPSLVEVDAAPSFSLDPAAIWAVRVPFDATTGSVSVGSVTDQTDVPVAAGRYGLVFEALPGRVVGGHPYTYVLRLVFCGDPDRDYAILKRGGELSTDKVLRRDADLL